MLFWLIAAPGLLHAQPKVAATIKPAQLVAQAITKGISEVALVLDGNQDPHLLSLKPSQRRLLDEADVLVWIGPALEQGLEKVVAGTDTQGRAIIQWLELKEADLISLNNNTDPHLWLSSHNVLLLAEKLRVQLQELDPANAENYNENFQVFSQQLLQLDQWISSSFAQQPVYAYAVYHKAFAYFEKEAGLAPVISVSESEEIQPGIKRLLQVRNALDDNQAQCLLIDPGVNVSQLKNVLGDGALQYVEVDVLANDIALSPTAYIEFKKSIAEKFYQCVYEDIDP